MSDIFIENYKGFAIYSLPYGVPYYFCPKLGRLNQFRTLKQIKRFIDKKAI